MELLIVFFVLLALLLLYGIWWCLSDIVIELKWANRLKEEEIDLLKERK